MGSLLGRAVYLALLGYKLKTSVCSGGNACDRAVRFDNVSAVDFLFH